MTRHHLPGRVAVVTGAGSGIGRAVARLMLADGYRVVLAGRREAQLLETGAGHAQALAVPCDVTVPDDVERLFAAALKQWGRVDVLFNNAGVFGPAASRGRDQPRGLGRDRGGEPHRLHAVRRGRRPGHEGPVAAGRADHQQRLDRRAFAPAADGGLHGHQTRHDRADQEHRTRRPRLRHHLRADRHRQHGHGADGRRSASAPARSRPTAAAAWSRLSRWTTPPVPCC